MKRKPLTVRIARWSATHPWTAMGMWVLLVVAALVISGQVSTVEAKDSGLSGETKRASEMIDSGAFPTEPAVERVLITSRSGALNTEAAMAAAVDAKAELGKVAEVAKVDDPIPSPKGTAIMVSLHMAGDPETAVKRVDPLLAATARVQQRHQDLLIEEVGYPSINKGLDTTINKDLQRAGILSVILTLLILLIAFGALIAAGVPVILGLTAVLAAIGLSALTSHLVPAEGSLKEVILLIGMAVGVDYSLFYLRREREERARGAGHLAAIEVAAATSGHAVVISGFAVIISMAGMFLANDNIFASFGVGSVMVVAIAMLGSLTVLPAILAKLGRWVDRPRIPLLWKLSAARQGADGKLVSGRIWPVILRPALRHPAITLLVSVGALLALAAPAATMKLALSSETDLPRSVPVMQSYDRLVAAYPSTGTSHTIVVKAAKDQAPAVATALQTLVRQASTDRLFAVDTEPRLQVSPNGLVTMLDLGSANPPGTKGADQSLDKLRTQLLPTTVGKVGGAEYAVTGEIAGRTDYANHIKDKLPIVIGFVLLLTFLVMTWTFRSIVIALTSITLNMLSVATAYGLLVLIFQHTWAEGILNFRSNHSVIAWLPLFLFVILFGLSMDYHVFVVSRIREAVARGVPNREAVAQGITRSAGVVTSAAVVMVAVFAIFGSLSILEMKQMGIGLALAVLLDATIIRGVVLPSVMTLLGDANWWAPKFLRSRQGIYLPDEPVAQPEPQVPELAPVG